MLAGEAGIIVFLSGEERLPLPELCLVSTIK
jgi:hypothetical protein